MKIVIAATSGESLINFRGKLIEEWVRLGHQVVCFSIEPVEEMTEQIGKLGAEYLQVSGDRTGIGIRSGLKMIADYKEALRKVNPDLVFLYMSKPIAFGGIAAIQCHIKKIYVFQTGLEIAFYSSGLKNAAIRFILKSIYRFVQKRANTIFFMCHEDLDKMVKWGMVDRDKTAYVDGSGVDMNPNCWRNGEMRSGKANR